MAAAPVDGGEIRRLAEAAVADAVGMGGGELAAALAAAAQVFILVFLEELIDGPAELQFLVHAVLLNADLAEKLMADIQLAVAGFAFLEGARSGGRLGKGFIGQNTAAAGQPVENEAFILDIDGAGDEAEEQLAVRGFGIGLQMGIEEEGIRHIRPDKDIAPRQAVPLKHQFIQGPGRGEGFLREGNGEFFLLLFLAGDAVADAPFLGHGEDKAFRVDAEPAGPAGDLFDFAGKEAAAVPAVELGGFAEDDPADGQGDAHADGVGGHDDGGFPMGEAADFLPAGDGGQGAVNHAGVDIVLLQLGGDGQDGPS